MKVYKLPGTKVYKLGSSNLSGLDYDSESESNIDLSMFSNTIKALVAAGIVAVAYYFIMPRIKE